MHIFGAGLETACNFRPHITWVQFSFFHLFININSTDNHIIYILYCTLAMLCSWKENLKIEGRQVIKLMEVRKAFQELMGPRSIKNTHQIHIIHFHFEVVNRVFFSMHLLGACEQVQFLSRYYPNILLFHFFYSFGLKHYQNLTLIYPAHQIIYALLISISSLYSSVKLHMHHVIT